MVEVLTVGVCDAPGCWDVDTGGNDNDLFGWASSPGVHLDLQASVLLVIDSQAPKASSVNTNNLLLFPERLYREMTNTVPALNYIGDNTKLRKDSENQLQEPP